MDKNKLVLPISILLGCIILGSFYYTSQLNKQQFIEKQQQIDLQAKKEADQAKAEQDKAQQDAERARAAQIQSDANAKQNALLDCMTRAHEAYVKAVTVACLAAGYSQADIDNLKCYLPQTVSKNQDDEQTQSQNACVKAYK